VEPDDLTAEVRLQTVADALAAARHALQASGIPEVSLEARVLLGHVLGQSRAWLAAYSDAQLSVSDAGIFLALVARRCRREPSAYLTGEKHWLDLVVEVNRNVLIPRPETEQLAELAVAQGLRIGPQQPQSRVLADIGTGSGILAIAMARGCPEARVYGIDSSPGALRTARRNAQRYGLANVQLVAGDLLDSLPEQADLIVANLPYIPTGELATLEPELAYEPRGALDGGADGLEVIRVFLSQLRGHIAPGAGILLECGNRQADAIARLIIERFPGAEVSIRKDFAGIDRFVVASTDPIKPKTVEG
jgi:release factor glutamine methyltransferase